MEGFADGETMHFRLWKKAKGKEYDMAGSFHNSSSVFEDEAIYFATGI